LNLSFVGDTLRLECPAFEFGFVVLNEQVAGSPERYVFNSTVFPTSGMPRKTDDGEAGLGMTTEDGTVSSLGSIFVSPSGSDSTGDGSEHAPFLSLHRAQQAVRTAKQQHGRATPVLLERGVHRLATQRDVVFTEDDSGSREMDALWASSPAPAVASSGDNPTSALLSGGLPVSGWEPAPGDGGGVWRANVSALVGTANWPFRTLRVGNELWSPSRWPLANSSRPWFFLQNWSCDKTFHPCNAAGDVRPGRLRAGLGTSSGRLESSIPAKLGIARTDLPALSVGNGLASANINLFGTFERDVLSQVLPIRQSRWNCSDSLHPTLAIDCYGYQPKQRYFFSNVRHGLVAGTWFLDTVEQFLYLRPEPQHASAASAAEWLRSTDVSAAASTGLVTVRGARWLRLQKLSFVDSGAHSRGRVCHYVQISTERDQRHIRL
jgi:hypothetical protein